MGVHAAMLLARFYASSRATENQRRTVVLFSQFFMLRVFLTTMLKADSMAFVEAAGTS